MKLFSLLLCMSVIGLAQGQDLKKVTRRSGNQNLDKEEYYVLKSDHSIRQGEYKKYHNDKLLTAGFYDNNTPDSTWTEYMGSKTVSIKHFNHGVPTGVWELNSLGGSPELQYDYTNGKVTDLRKNKPADSAQVRGIIIEPSGLLTKTFIDKAPIRLMGSGEYNRFLMMNIRYPMEALSRGERGTSVVAIHIDETGKAFDFTTYASAGEALDQEAIRVMKLIECYYLPAVQDGHKVKAVLLQPVIFRTN